MKRSECLITPIISVLTVFALLACVFVNCFAEIPIFTSSDGRWKYSLINGDEAYITSASCSEAAYMGTESYVVVPEYIDGHKVFGIGKYAFYGVDGITSVSFPRELIRNDIDFSNDMSSVSEYYCYKNSQADTFAMQDSYLKNIVHYFGDVNLDGSIELADYSLMLGYLTDEAAADFSDLQLRTADYNTDTAVDAFDLFAVNKIINAGMKIISNDDDSHYAIIDWD